LVLTAIFNQAGTSAADHSRSAAPTRWAECADGPLELAPSPRRAARQARCSGSTDPCAQ